MFICDRLRELREDKKLSQGDIEKRTGLLRCYISRVENGHTTPSIDTLEKMARALEVPMYRLFYDGEQPPATVKSVRKANGNDGFGQTPKQRTYLHKLSQKLIKLGPRDQGLLFSIAAKLSVREVKR